MNEEEIKINEALDNLPVEFPADWDTTKVAEVKVEGTRKAPIPMGYTKSGITGDADGKGAENTIAGGLVIYQIPEGATVDWANNQITLSGATGAINLQENVNQYVWIPVDDINDMVMCKHNTKDTKVDGTATADGKIVCELELQGDNLVCNTHGYSTAIELTTENIFTTGLAGRLYGVDSTYTTVDGKDIYQTSMAFTEESKTTHSFSEYREPHTIMTFDKDDATSGKKYMATAGITDGKVATFRAQLNSDFIEMAKSVAKYGGFYISRYEAGYDTTDAKNKKVISKKNQKVLTAASSSKDNYIAGNMWYRII